MVLIQVLEKHRKSYGVVDTEILVLEKPICLFSEIEACVITLRGFPHYEYALCSEGQKAGVSINKHDVPIYTLARWIMIEFNIVNVVATADLDQIVSLEELGKLEYFLHDGKSYGGRVAYFKSPGMEGRVAIFASGKMISVGTKSEKQAFIELRQTRDLLVDEGIIKSIRLKLEVRNMVVVVNLRKTLELEYIAMRHKAIYEPEQFQGAIMRIEDPCKATILLFASGKAVVAGLKSVAYVKPVVMKVANLT